MVFLRTWFPQESFSVRRCLHVFTLVFCLTPLISWADFRVQWLEPRDGSEALFAGALQDSAIIRDAAKLDSVGLAWPAQLEIALGGDGVPRYDASTYRVHLPYSYLAHAVRAQLHFEDSRVAALKKGLDVVEYSLFHLLGHALIGHHSVDEDERAEAFATWLMVTQFVNGGEQWLDNVHAFGRASQKLDGPLEDYWHSHGLSKRASEQLNCLVVGSRPEQYLQRFPGLVESPEQASACKNQWNVLDDAMRKRIEQTSGSGS